MAEAAPDTPPELTPASAGARGWRIGRPWLLPLFAAVWLSTAYLWGSEASFNLFVRYSSAHSGPRLLDAAGPMWLDLIAYIQWALSVSLLATLLRMSRRRALLSVLITVAGAALYAFCHAAAIRGRVMSINPGAETRPLMPYIDGGDIVLLSLYLLVPAALIAGALLLRDRAARN